MTSSNKFVAYKESSEAYKQVTKLVCILETLQIQNKTLSHALLFTLLRIFYFEMSIFSPINITLYPCLSTSCFVVI